MDAVKSHQASKPEVAKTRTRLFVSNFTTSHHNLQRLPSLQPLVHITSGNVPTPVGEISWHSSAAMPAVVAFCEAIRQSRQITLCCALHPRVVGIVKEDDIGSGLTIKSRCVSTELSVEKRVGKGKVGI